jgi:hypothetical protein
MNKIDQAILSSNTKQEKYPKFIAQGDVHGQLEQLVDNLATIGLSDSQANWYGNDAIFLQIGDMIDRGPQSIEAWNYICTLQKNAAMHHGQVVRLLGNHELLVLQNKFNHTNFANPEGFRERVKQDILSAKLQASYVFMDHIFIHGCLRNDMRKILVREIAAQKQVYSRTIKMTDIATYMNQLLVQAVTDDDYHHPIFRESFSRGGDWLVGGIFWSDFSEMHDDAANPYKQIVGHLPPGKEGMYRVSSDNKVINIDGGLSPGHGEHQTILTIDEN